MDRNVKEGFVPPGYLNWLLVLQFGLHFVVPVKRVIHPPYNYLGVALVLASIFLNVYTTRFMQENSAALDFFEVSRRLLVTGPFRFSRNPIYLSGITVSLGIAISLGSLMTFLFPAILFLALDRLYIPAEETRLANRFGQEYRDYKRRVRRWI